MIGWYTHAFWHMIENSRFIYYQTHLHPRETRAWHLVAQQHSTGPICRQRPYAHHTKMKKSSPHPPFLIKEWWVWGCLHATGSRHFLASRATPSSAPHPPPRAHTHHCYPSSRQIAPFHGRPRRGAPNAVARGALVLQACLAAHN